MGQTSENQDKEDQSSHKNVEVMEEKYESENDQASEDQDTEDQSSDDNWDCVEEEDEPTYDSPENEEDYVSFTKDFLCYPLSHINKSHLEDGNKIIMPASALETLMSMGSKLEYPMLFRISNTLLGHVSHCGVLEFSAEEGHVYVPKWMMDNMKLVEGQLVCVEDVSLPKGTYMKIQPHSVKFIASLLDPKSVLERVLKDFSCLSVGDTIMINHENKSYHVDIIDAKPSHAVSLFETDCEVDFAQPLDYKEPEIKQKVEVSKQGVEEIKQKGKVSEQGVDSKEGNFKPFSGIARRLDGKPAMAKEVEKESSAAGEVAKMVEATSRKRPGKIVFSKDDDSSSPAKKSPTAVLVEEVQKFQPFTGKKYTLSG